jgi:hypothetical protein
LLVGVDNNGDGANNDRPVINGSVIGKSAFRGTPISDVSIFLEECIKTSERTSLLLRLEGFNLFNHGNFLGRGVTVYGDATTPAARSASSWAVSAHPQTRSPRSQT